MIDDKVLEGLREYIKDHYIPVHYLTFGFDLTVSESVSETDTKESSCAVRKAYRLRSIFDDASEYIKKHRKPDGFAHTLDRKRKEKGLTPAKLYKKANIDRRQYSRFMGPEGRHPSMNTVVSFGLALELSRQDFDDFLQTAGYTLSNSSSRDVCIMYCIENGIFDIDEVNTLLFAIGIDPLSRE
jgi:hypothetical protein